MTASRDPYHRRVVRPDAPNDAEVSRQWGSARIAAGIPQGGVPAGSYQTVTIRYTVGSLGLDEDGGLKLAFRFVSDMGWLQTDDGRADDFVTATTTGRADIAVQVERKGTIRPFQRTVFLHVRNASLAAGDEVDIRLGDTGAGSRGWRQQTYVERPFPVRVSVDPLGSHDYRELPHDLGWDVVPGPAARYVLIAPSFVITGQRFPLRVKAEDAWGNPLRDLSRQRPEVLALRGGAERELGAAASHDAGVWSFDVALSEEGSHFFAVAGALPSAGNGTIATAERNAPARAFHWCDLHGQSGETVGSGTLTEYFHFARHYGFLDGCAHQGNDFQIGPDLWQRIKRAAHDAYEPGAFVTFPGYEWSGTEAMGGDHNVLFCEDDPPLYRSSGWLDGNPFEETAPLPELYRALRRHDALTIAHVGGRPASFTVTDPEIEPLWEIHSAWGTFEWVYERAFEQGIRIGFVCNSDGHKCRPGASYPGAGIFGTLGGLTCLLSETRDQAGFWEALRRRRCYGTTGQRIVVDADMNGHPIGSEFEASRGTVRARVLGTAPIRLLELLRRGEVVARRSPGAGARAGTLLLRFGGARIKGRSRMVRWRGRVTVAGNRLARAKMNGVHSPIYGIERRDDHGLDFRCATTGNLVNLQLEFTDGMQGSVRFETDDLAFELDLATLGPEPRSLFEAPLDRRVEAMAVDTGSLPLELEASFEVSIGHDTAEPYFLRVTQLDEGKAWTSPFYVRAPAKRGAAGDES